MTYGDFKDLSKEQLMIKYCVIKYLKHFDEKSIKILKIKVIKSTVIKHFDKTSSDGDVARADEPTIKINIIYN